ncbi:alternate-type signal peptide domain-containing protein [Pseudoclavibacter chungangensis]|uniref:Alternate-type signal peptide domain-containing protein n=1 Tax=Pseudoclavibacter chungangensis TaxID=587635 RepID=A0A7J5C214_9MICO|nr:alternate-type signal peptide domain-containing protein [Pseudoclavibacter chungangensis]KAB1662503.1 alternate-type signal peptide domain-containing protein [Pseudoclavibacter chungangensis]NYJ68541.1 alternate signal-mediated exported protein [Pseudoclavibacter chungangensis]
MNKLTKGAIAASAALVLLLAGGGTLAYWNDTADLDGANITAGNLQLTQSSAA